MSKRRKNQDLKVIFALLGILLVCVIVIGFGFWKFFYSGAGSTKYGDRLDGIEEYVLDKNLEDKIKAIYGSESSVGEVKVTIEGKIIYINIDFVSTVKKATAQSLAVKSLNEIGEKNLTYYDVQYILTYSGSEENSNFPMFGAKSSSSLKVVW